MRVNADGIESRHEGHHADGDGGPSKRTRHTVTLNDYQRLTRRTVPESMTKSDILMMGVMGCCGEAGELMEVLKKHLYQERPLDTDRLSNELGDILWYVARVADGLGLDLSLVAMANIEKLQLRYPDGWSLEDSLAKRDRESLSQNHV
jgi:NTP pyrophosphatase (non-canonical NTP hydrolase)